MTGIIIYKNTPWWRLFHFHCPLPHCSLSESLFFRETTGHKINRYFLVTCWKGVTLGNYKRTLPMSLIATLGSLPSLCGQFLGETRHLYSVFQRDRDPVFWVWQYDMSKGGWWHGGLVGERRSTRQVHLIASCPGHMDFTQVTTALRWSSMHLTF
jgi:hypothetical protein